MSQRKERRILLPEHGQETALIGLILPLQLAVALVELQVIVVEAVTVIKVRLGKVLELVERASMVLAHLERALLLHEH